MGKATYNNNNYARETIMASLGESLRKEMKRNRELLVEYTKIGGLGIIGATMLQADLDRAEKAIASGDCVAMIQVWEKLKENK